MTGAADSNARRILLPRFMVTQTAGPDDNGAERVEVPVSEATPEGCYYVRPVMLEGERSRIDGKPRWVPHQVNLFPVVLNADGSPWPEANLYLLLRLENTPYPVMATFAGAADDLAAYRRFLDGKGIDWTDFPSTKLSRPTYRYNAYLRLAAMAGELAASTAKRRMSTVVNFYRWLIQDGAFKPTAEPWRESDRFVEFKDAHGRKVHKAVVTTDVAIRAPTQSDPYDGMLDDGGRLRPLPSEEQQWLAEALAAAGNSEMTLVHLVAWLTGARIQTVLTLRIRHVKDPVANGVTEIRIPVGPGTGVDTKGDKRQILHVPVWLYERLRNYALSERAAKRRAKASERDQPAEYLFLSNRGAPLYQSKEDSRVFNPESELHHAKSGQAVRQFIAERVLPYIRKTYQLPEFHFQFHDLRATFGMNLTDSQLGLVEKGEITLHQAREFVKQRMGHESSSTTDRYLQFRQQQVQVRSARFQYETHLKNLADLALGNDD